MAATLSGIGVFFVFTGFEPIYGFAFSSGIIALSVAIGWNAEPMLKTAVTPLEIDANANTKSPDSSVAEIEEIIEPPPEPEKPCEVEDIPGWLTMVELAGGTFQMGSNERDYEKPIHSVTLSDFAISQTPVTQALYAEVMGDKEVNTPSEKERLLPKNNISWYAAIDFCNALSKKQNLTPVYERNGDEVEWLPGADGYRLPTETEWEYACRAGTTSRWFIGDKAEALGEYAWYDKAWK